MQQKKKKKNFQNGVQSVSNKSQWKFVIYVLSSLPMLSVTNNLTSWWDNGILIPSNKNNALINGRTKWNWFGGTQLTFRSVMWPLYTGVIVTYSARGSQHKYGQSINYTRQKYVLWGKSIFTDPLFEAKHCTFYFSTQSTFLFATHTSGWNIYFNQVLWIQTNTVINTYCLGIICTCSRSYA